MLLNTWLPFFIPTLFSVKFSLKTFQFLVLWGFCVTFLLAGDTQMIERNENVVNRHSPSLPHLAISNG